MRPYVICHMHAPVDGKIDGAALEAVTGEGEYEALGATLNGEAWICGRTAMQQHFAEEAPFVSASNRPAGPGLSTPPCGPTGASTSCSTRPG